MRCESAAAAQPYATATDQRTRLSESYEITNFGISGAAISGFSIGVSCFFTYATLPAAISSCATLDAFVERAWISGAEPFCSCRARRAATITYRKLLSNSCSIDISAPQRDLPDCPVYTCTGDTSNFSSTGLILVSE